MSRLHTDPVEVRRRDDEPTQFLWRGRLYVVREVLASWTEAGSWWRSATLASLRTGEPAPDAGAATGPAGAATGPAGIDDGEQAWWRVEAAAGSAAGSGVYDLCCDGATGTWSLARVLD